MAGGLAVLLLAAGTLSAGHWLHGLLHRDASPNHHFCLVCAFAKGQATPAVAVALLSQPMVEIGACPVIRGEVLLPAPCFLLPRTRVRLAPELGRRSGSVK